MIRDKFVLSASILLLQFSINLKVLCLLLFISVYSFSFAQTTVIPDTNFEQELINQGIDTNGLNGDILNVDAQAVTILNLGNNGILDITGINAFTNVTDLDTGTNQIIDIGLTGLTQLINFRIDDNEALLNLDLTQNILLENLYIETSSNGALSAPITTLDLSQNVNLISIEFRWLKNLTDFILPITNTLTNVNIRSLADQTLDFSLLDGLENLQIRGSEVNTVITLPNVHTNLSYLNLTSIDIPTIDISNYINLEAIYFWGTYVENLLLPNSTTLDDIFIILHNIQNPLDFSTLPNLKDLSITINSSVPLVVDVTQNLVLDRLDLNDNDMNSINVTQNPILKNLNLNNNNLLTLDVTQNPLLDTLNAHTNQIAPTVDLSQNIELETLNLGGNQITNLNVINNIDLRWVALNYNLFTGAGLDLTQNIILSSLNISNNQIESLDISQNINLFSFDLSFNIFPGNDILNQFSTIISNSGSLRGRFIANNNLLSGTVPDFYVLYDPTIQTRRFQLNIKENRFEYGDFENQHLGLVDLTTTQSIGPSPDIVIQVYEYAPQAKVDIVDTINATAGDSVTLTTVCSGAQNHYTWFKDGVAIPGAPDAPTYILTSVNGCDAAVYHSEITSDLVPFENADPAGTDGKNLLLIRNDITLNITSPPENCVMLTAPFTGATNVDLNATLEWSDNLGACGYFISIGTTAGGTDILNNVDVGDVTNYNLGTNFPPSTQVYVTITPYFYSGNTLSCPEVSFTTGTIESPTSCTNLLLPLDGAVNIALTTNIEWESSDFATGYIITIGTTVGGTDIANAIDVGNMTVYNPSINLPESTLIYVTIAPYNGLGNITGCFEETFTTETFVTIPDCTFINNPDNGIINVPVTTDINWDNIAIADGYILTVGTTSGGNDILDNFDVGNVFSYNLPNDLPDSTEVFVTVIPYNSSGVATGCVEESFTTETITVPLCANLIAPLNGAVDVSINTDLSWTAIGNATGYILTVGTTSGGTDIVNNQDVGNVTTFNLPANLPDETQIFVSIIPYNSTGNAVSCVEESFTTEVVIPLCANLIAPLNGVVGVSINTDLSWNAISNATGYILTVGTVSGATDILNNQDVGNVTAFDLPTDLPDETQIFVSIIPYNSAGNAIACVEESFTTEVVIPLCTNLITPLNGAVDVSIASDLSWTAIGNATGYILTVGTTSGGTDIVNNQDVGNVTTFNLPANLPDETQIFVSIIPYNSTGDAVSCIEESFTTEVVIPLCANLIAPLNGAVDVSINADLSWNVISNATGYILTVGTTSGGTDILNNQDVGNITTFNLPTSLPNETQIFVSIIPYNSAGNAISCVEESFTTEVVIPLCTSLLTPLNGAVDISIASDLSWNAIGNATGYTLTVGSTSGGTDIVNNQNVGNSTTFNLPTNLPYETEIFVSITSYNSAGNAIGCLEESFTTEVIIPLCTNLTTPLNGAVNVSTASDLSWNAISNATGYILTVGTTSGGTNIINAQDVGNTTSFSLPIDLPSLTQVFVSIIPYNSAGDAIGCLEESFTTELPLPSCSNLISPTFQETDVSSNTSLTWSASDFADGYIISIGTSTGSSDILTPTNVGNVTTFNPPVILPNFTQIFITIDAYNASGSTVCGDDQFTTEDLTPLCVDLTFPNNGQTDVAIINNISWEVDANAVGYILNVGTTPGGNDLVNAIDTGNITTYSFPNNLPQNSTIYINITPYNLLGNAIGCVEQSFTTELFVPECANLLTPLNEETDVPISTGLSWTNIDHADGYILSVGTTSGGVDIVNAQDLGNINNYAFAENLSDNTTFYVLVIAYNTEGNAINCNEYNFTTEIVIPECATLIIPFNNEIDVSVNTSLTWNSVSNASGYIMSIGTTPNGSEIINDLDVGNVTTYVPLIDFTDSTIVYVNITPYNSTGNSLSCNNEQFTTEDRNIRTPAFFTPNGDEFNQFWKVEDPKKEIKYITIFDRFGKLLYRFKANSNGWDGTFNGENVPTNDYWYLLEKIDGTIERGHFTLKR